MLHPVLAMAIGIIAMMLLVIFTKMHAFPSLIISAILKHRHQGLRQFNDKYRYCYRIWLYNGNFP